MSAPLLDIRDDENLCKLVGIDIDKKLQDLLKSILPSKQDKNNAMGHQKFEKSNGALKALDFRKLASLKAEHN